MKLSLCAVLIVVALFIGFLLGYAAGPATPGTLPAAAGR